MGRLAAFFYGLAAYALFFVTFLYAMGFVSGLVVPKPIDGGMAGPSGEALSIDLLLMSLFAIQHSVMARQGFMCCSPAWCSTCCSGSGDR